MKYAELNRTEPKKLDKLSELVWVFRKRADKWETNEGELGRIVAAEMRIIIDAFANLKPSKAEGSSELAAPTLLSCDLAARMEAEAKQFELCARQHDIRRNYSAAAVAHRAQEILTRFAAEVKQDNDQAH